MVQTYNLFGAKVGSHYLAMGVLGALFGGISLAVGGGSKSVAAAPPLNAGSADEADFIKKFLESAEAETKEKEKH